MDRRPQSRFPDVRHHGVASDGGAEHWATIASLIETCKLIGVEPQAYLADVISRIVNGHPQSRLDDLLPWAYPTLPDLKAVA
jgi:transposase